MSEREGQRLGNYRLHRLLGEGSFAEVYLGEHLYLRTYAAIKLLHTSLDEHDERLFLAEAQTIAQLTHPHIVHVREFAIERSTPFLVMDYAPGGTLRYRYPRGTCLSLEKTVSYVKEVAAALQYAHNRGIIHRDVKPENLLQGAEGVLLSDFGISVSAPLPNTNASQQWAGTLPYTAPEQYQGQTVFASDQYALAILVYEWLCGVRPFEGSAVGLAYQHAQVPPPALREKDPSLPEAVEVVVLRALSKEPAARYVSVLTFARALERASRGESSYEIEVNAPTESADSPQQRLARRVFLSHAPLDDITRLRADLSLREIAVQEDSTPTPQEEQTRQALRAAQMLLLVLTPQTRASAAVQEHLRIASLYRRSLLCVWAQGQQLEALVPVGAQQAPIIDARGPHYGRALDEILLALEREQRGGGTVEPPLPALDFEPRNPYKGLRPFTQSDRVDFFGRSAVVQELLAQLKGLLAGSAVAPEEQRARLLAVVGPSGSGKSSLVLAGLLPRLREGARSGSERWVYLEPLLPGKQPLDALSLLLAPRFPEQGLQAVREVLGRAGGFGLHQLGLALRLQPQTRVVLVIDQFEELFAADVSEQERKLFIDLLVTAATEPRGPVLVLLTLRADFYDRPFAYPALGRLIQQQQCAILPMSVEELREVIERPAFLPDVRLLFDEDLVGDLLFDLQGQVGALPLLEFALEQLFHHRRERRLTRAAYQEIGGVRGALSKHAEATYDALASQEHRRLARTLFLRLVQPGGEGQEPLRRRADAWELVLEDEEQTRVLREGSEAFLAARLITMSQQGQSASLEISHEALIRQWPRLASWLREAREDIELQQAISKDVREWQRRDKPKDRLYRGSQLKESLAWRARNSASGSEAAFLRASSARRTRGHVGIFLAVLLLLGVLTPVGLFLQQQFASPTVTTLKDDVPGSLRQAIANVRPGGTILIDASLKGIMHLNKTLVVSKDLTIRGPGVNQLTIRGTRDQGYLIHVLHHSTVTLSQLTFSDPTPAIGPVIRNEGTLTLDTCHITGNTQTSVAGPGTGGEAVAILNFGGTLTLQNSVISHNTLTSSIAGYAGGIQSGNGTLTIKNSQVTDNTVITSGKYASGGGIESLNSKIMLINSIVARNKVIGGAQTTLVAGGGIYSGNDTITLTNSAITDNSIAGRGAKEIGLGGGIASLGSAITINNSRISGNAIVSVGAVFGGAIGSFYCPANNCTITNSLTVNKSMISNNTIKSLQSTGDGGGIFTYILTITDSVVSANSVNALTTDRYGATGGGIDTQGTVTVNRTTVSLNTVNNSKGGAAGGGLFAYEGSKLAVTLSLTNCTIADNKVQGGTNAGGGGLAIHVLRSHNSSINFCTVYGNSASQGGGIATNWINEPKIPDLSLKNSIVAANSARIAPDISGAITTNGHNLVQHFTDALVKDPVGKHNTDISGESSANLGIDAQLRNNGGPTSTLALQANSPAVSAIPAASCDTATDQRGVKRLQHNACDIGAYQHN